jgi:hypothetical protein
MTKKSDIGNKVKVNLSLYMPGRDTQGNTKPWHQMDISDQLCASAASPSVPTEHGAQWDPQTVGTFWNKEIFLAPAGN